MRNSAKRILSLLLSLVLVLSLVPATVFATEAETTYAAVNTTTGVTYDLVGDALDAAQAGQTIQVTKDTEDHTVLVDEDITLDLNGYQLDASYVIGYGQIIDSSEGTTGYLVVSPQRLLVRSDNLQLPVKDGKGYRFVEVIGFNATMINENKYAFQPLFEADAHEYLVSAESGVSIQVDVSWKQAGAKLHIPFAYSDAQEVAFINSYKPATGKYGKMFTLTQLSKGYYEDLGFEALVVSDTGVIFGAGITRPEIKEDGKVEVDSDNKLVGDVTVTNPQGSATIQAGTQLEDASAELKLTTSRMDKTGTDLTLDENETLDSFDIHVSGIAKNNTVPVIITLNKLAPEFLNKGNLELYHVENGETVPMTRVYTLEEVDAHNEYYYDIITGTVTLAMSSFSEVALASNTENGWQGNLDYTWYDADAEKLTIANADQLAALGAIVGGMKKVTGRNDDGTYTYSDVVIQDSFEGQTIELIADINLGDKNDASTNLFYPIGYYNDAKSYTKPTDSTPTAANVTSFQGTFDGQGHTISNFYQNTWQMWGNYDGNYYKAAMGLFGYVVNGTVKNLTVDNFSSDGEFTPTGVIAAYAVNSTFENIALTNCNPRVYNTGNGGIVGIGGNTDDPDTYKLTFNNITIDNTNKITALWGSWDVACGGLVGMFRGAGHAYMTNCHVAAQIDVYNDVCGNYQYYWYRYAGMMIGTNKNMITDEAGYTVPETSKFHAEDCTVHFGEWNDYYYCELVSNSLASYTHDHQFSRLTLIEDVKEIQDENGNWNTTGNFAIVDSNTHTGTCYHIRQDAQGAFYQHSHNDYNRDGNDDYETVNGQEILVENNQVVYLPFNQLFTGYGWGVKHIPVYNGEDYAFEGITILDREEGNSVPKFQKADTAKDTYTTETTVTIGELFKAAAIDDEKLTIKPDKVQVFVSPVDKESTAGGTYVAAKADADGNVDWTNGTLTFSGTGAATITITDYYFCEPTTINVNIEDLPDVKKFETKFTGDFLYRVGNAEGSTVALGTMFTGTDVTAETVEVSFETIAGNASGKYTSNTTWTNGKVQFSGTGVVKLTITDNDYCIPTELYLEVIKAKNATSSTHVTSDNVVLLNDITTNGISVYDGYGLFGNGFTITLNPENHTTTRGAGFDGYIHMYGGIIDNVYINGPVYPAAHIYRVQGETGTDSDDKVNYFRNGVIIESGNATITNSYLSGTRAALYVKKGGDVLVENTTISGGAYANIEIDTAHSVTLRDVTTVQKEVQDSYGQGKNIIGTAIVVDKADAELILEGLTQYNWMTYAQWDAMLDSYESQFPKLFTNNDFKELWHYNSSGTKIVNTGIIFAYEMSNQEPNMRDRDSETNGYTIKAVTINNVNGAVYTKKAVTDKDKLDDSVTVAPNYIPSEQGTSYIPPAFNFAAAGLESENGVMQISYENGSSYTLTSEVLDQIFDSTKYGEALNYTVSMSGVDYTNKNIVFGSTESKNYTITYSVVDNRVYDKNGNLTSDTIAVEKNLNIFATVADKSAAAPEFTFYYGTNGSAGAGSPHVKQPTSSYASAIEQIGDAYYIMPNVTATSANAIGSKTISGTTVYYPIVDGINVRSGRSSDYDFQRYYPIFKAIGINDNGTEYTYSGTKEMPETVSWVSAEIDSGNGASALNDGFGLYNSEYLCKVQKKAGNDEAGGTSVVKFSYTAIDGNTYIYYVGFRFYDEEESDSCLVEGTMITMADGSQKAVEELKVGDMVMIFNHVSGQYEAMPLIFNTHADEAEAKNYDVLYLQFADGKELKIVEAHGLFDMTLMQYVYITNENYQDYIGHEFYALDSNGTGGVNVKLTNAFIKNEKVRIFCPVTYFHMNSFANGLLNTPNIPGGITGLVNYFEYDPDLKYNEEKMQADIEKYGLYSYEDFSEYISEDAYNSSPSVYLKVAVGKGMITYEQIVDIIKWLLEGSLIDNQ